MFVTLSSLTQKDADLNQIRAEFQEIKSEEDIERILSFKAKGIDVSEVNLIQGYQAASTCMLANYVQSPMSKLKHFNAGKKQLEALIEMNKEIEIVYLRLLIQLNVPKILNYHQNIEGDVAYLSENLTQASIEAKYKQTMINNLISVAEDKEVKEALLQIELI